MKNNSDYSLKTLAYLKLSNCVNISEMMVAMRLNELKKIMRVRVRES